MVGDREKFKQEFIQQFIDSFRNLFGKDIDEGTNGQKFNALIIALRELIVSDWIRTNNDYREKKLKQVYYFSIEFLPGRFLDSYLINLGIRTPVQEALAEMGLNLEELEEEERDVALGSGGLGRLASCFLDSMASCGIAGHGCGIRYKYGLVQQQIIDGNQVELPDRWLATYNAWQFPKRDKALEVRFGGKVYMKNDGGKLGFEYRDYESVMAVPYDVPIVGYGNETVNTMRLWSAEIMPGSDDFQINNRQEYRRAVEYKYSVESLSEVLYPDDSNYQGQVFRLKQQYFFVSAGIQSIVRYYKKKYGCPLEDFDDYIAIHINDTHPTLVIPELMRIFVDEEGLSWDDAWRLVTNAVSYTNHTIMPEAMEKWPVDIMRDLLPRIYQIIVEIDRRIRISLEAAYPGSWDRINSMAVINNGQVHMAHLAVHGSYSVNGVARIHTEILKKDVLRNFYEYCGYKFNNKTNGITHRRWLLNANPGLSSLITEYIGGSWVAHPGDLANLLPCAGAADFLRRLGEVKQDNKQCLAQLIKNKYGLILDTNSIFDVHIKRIHAYKRQLLNALHILHLYNSIRENPSLDIPSRTFLFAGKAAPSYHLAKAIIKFINALAVKINNDTSIDGRIKVCFLENYSVTLAENIVPAAEVSEQISTASKEASGTGNMKMMMNGAVTLGTLDGANIEIREEAGEENFVAFGMTADEVISLNQSREYSAFDTIAADCRLGAIVEQLAGGFLPMSREELMWINNYIYQGNDEFYVLKDFDAYVAAQARTGELYKNRDKWLHMSAMNIAKAGHFSSDRTIHDYTVGIWQVEPRVFAQK